MEVNVDDAAWTKAQLRLAAVLRDARAANQPPPWPTSCSICLALLRLLDSPRRKRVELLVDTPTDVDGRRCSNHAAVFENCDLSGIRLTKPARQQAIYIYPDVDERHGKLLGLEAPWEGLRVSSAISTPSDLDIWCVRPRIINSEWIDLNIIRSWLAECAENHDANCEGSELEQHQASPLLLLIDVSRKCLVRRDGECRHVALSYVWGRANVFRTTTDNLEQLCNPGALAEPNVRLPKTLSQAINLTRELGERYLWIDALCIVQDGSDLTEQLNNMANLFTKAYLTIVAAQGDNADAGIRGILDISEPRCAIQRVANLVPGHKLVRPSSKHVWSDSLLEPWSTRAWTFQEAMCSRRILYFAHDSVRWVCKTVKWSEESDSTDCTKDYIVAQHNEVNLRSPQLSAGILPTLSEYEMLVNGFNVRKLTHPEDALAAFAGVATALGQKFAGGLISGLPEVFFDICLLWQPLRLSGPTKRRQALAVNEHNVLPSWSWAGWETEVTWPYTWNFNHGPVEPTPSLVNNIRPFYRVELSYTSCDGQRAKINATWFNHATTAMDGTLPAGWKSHTAQSDSMEDYGMTESIRTFTHTSNRTIQFLFPIPLSPDTIPSSIPAPARTTKYLHLRTTSGLFKLGRTRKSMTRIHTLDNKPAGTLWHHDETESAYLHVTTGPFASRDPIELIAILGCTVPKEHDLIWEAPDVARFNGTQEVSRTEDVYNVLWIVRGEDKSNPDVAYRKGVGVVERSIWESNSRGWVDVTLG